MSKELLDELLKPIEEFDHFQRRFEGKFDLKDRFEDYISAAARVISYHAGFRIARAALDRMLLRGYYSDVHKIIDYQEDQASVLSENELSDCADCEDDKIPDEYLDDGAQDEYTLYSIAPDGRGMKNSKHGSP